MSEWVGEQVFAMINYRSQNSLQTIITTNYGLNALAGRMATGIKDKDSDDSVIYS